MRGIAAAHHVRERLLRPFFRDLASDPRFHELASRIVLAAAVIADVLGLIALAALAMCTGVAAP